MTEAQSQQIEALKREAPRSRFLRGSMVVLTLLALAAWISGDDLPGAPMARRLANLERFLHELVPPASNGAPLAQLAAEVWSPGLAALANTLALGVVAIVAAAVGAVLLLPLTARRPLPPKPPFGHLGRALLVLSRSLPEYLLAYLLLAMLGAGSWAVIVALALHNLGVLGRHYAEALESTPPGPSRALAAAGSPRLAALLYGAAPNLVPRTLLYLFYRFESCVREATVLGMLGVLSLGAYVQESRAAGRYDLVLVHLGLASLLVLGADLLSDRVRGAARVRTEVSTARGGPPRSAR